MKAKKVKIVLIHATSEDYEFGLGILDAILMTCVISKSGGAYFGIFPLLDASFFIATGDMHISKVVCLEVCYVFVIGRSTVCTWQVEPHSE
jgi:hypothetical protein